MDLVLWVAFIVVSDLIVLKKIIFRLLKKCRLNNEDIFTEKCIEKLTDILPQKENLVKEFNTTDNVIQLIFDALTKSIDHDLRLDIDQKPLFKNECIKITDLKKGDCVTGNNN